MTLIVGRDPGETTGAGTSVWCTDRGLLWFGDELPEGSTFDHAVVEGPWVGPMGKVQMWGLGFFAGWWLGEVSATRKFILRPGEWRVEWNAAWVSKPKSVIVGRLRRDLKLPETATDDQVEACGIAGGWARRLARAGTKKLRRGCEVKRGSNA